MRNKITADIETLPAGRHSDGGGLYLVVRPNLTRTFSFKYSIAGRAREIGLGGLTLDEARQAATDHRASVKAGNDPQAAKRKAQAVAKIASDDTRFGPFAMTYIKTVLAGGFKTPKTANDWVRTIQIHAERLLPMRIADISMSDVKAVLLPIWKKKHKTASELRGRIAKILSAATVEGHRTGDNPAAWKNNLEHVMPNVRRKKKHHPAVPYKHIGELVAALRANDNPCNLTCRALEFLILTAARSTEVRKMRVGEVDFETATWTVPAERMKLDKEHDVALSRRALELLRAQIPANAPRNAYVWRGIGVEATCIGQNSLIHCLARFDPTKTPHGLRSTFRDWAGEVSAHPDARTLAEYALSHHVGGSVERAYSRGDSLEKRRPLMEAWAAFIG